MGGCTTSHQDCLFLSVYSEEGAALTFRGKVRLGVLPLFDGKYWGFYRAKPRSYILPSLDCSLYHGKVRT